MNELAHCFTFLWLWFDMHVIHGPALWIYNRVIWIYKLLLCSIKINKIGLYTSYSSTLDTVSLKSNLKSWLGQHYFGHDCEKCVHTSDTSCPIVTRTLENWVTESILRILSETWLVMIEMHSHLLFILTESCLCCPSHLFLLRHERSLSFTDV